MNNRIREIRKKASLSMKSFGEKIGISSAAVSKIETGVNMPSEQTIRAICQNFNVNREWLEDGAGEMFVNRPVLPLLADRLRQFPRTVDALANMTDEELLALENFLERYFSQKQK